MDLMKFSLTISEKAYLQEVDREKVIKEKVDYLFKWITFFITVINIAITIMIKQSSIDFSEKKYVLWYTLLMVCLIVSMIDIVLLQFPGKLKTYPLGSDILKHVQENPEEYSTDLVQVYKEILYRDVMTNQLKKRNNHILYGIIIADVLIIISVLLLAVFLGKVMTVI